MKFAHEFRSVLQREHFPARWVASAVPYGQLKKCLKRVQKEFQNLGIDTATSTVSLRYNPENSHSLSKITLYTRPSSNTAIDLNIPPNAMSHAQEIVDINCPESHLQETDFNKKSGLHQVALAVTFDVEFFDILQEDVLSLDLLQSQEQKRLNRQIETLSTAIKILAKPSKFCKTDMYRWRELFDLYLQAGIFFSTHELDHGTQNSSKAAEKLEWFREEILRRRIGQMFKLSASREALSHFLTLNSFLLQTLKFQEINQKAIFKILKKFDKRTKLNATSSFLRLKRPDAIMTGSIVKDVYSKFTQELIRIVPQVDDYLCPICFAVVWRPIRLKCDHLFCIQCIILLQRNKKSSCPLCRGDVVMEANQDNIDGELTLFLKKNFPKEVKAKQIAHETSEGIERYGIYYKHPSERDCFVM
ncbi:hypothetical protein K3495_g1874 [Podosphaera aphanis]|nr:hypothetical protein K3495_g1874 [Podosphaera aphanis]